MFETLSLACPKPEFAFPCPVRGFFVFLFFVYNEYNTGEGFVCRNCLRLSAGRNS